MLAGPELWAVLGGSTSGGPAPSLHARRGVLECPGPDSAHTPSLWAVPRRERPHDPSRAAITDLHDDSSFTHQQFLSVSCFWGDQECA